MTDRVVHRVFVAWSIACVAVVLGAVTLTAQAAAAVAAGAADDAHAVAGAAALGQQSLASLLVSFYMPRILESLKGWDRFPWLKDGAYKLNRLIAIGVSTLQGAGLTWVYHQGTAGGDGWTFALGSKHSTFEEFLVAVGMAFAAQEYFYDSMPTVQAKRLADAFAKGKG